MKCLRNSVISLFLVLSLGVTVISSCEVVTVLYRQSEIVLVCLSEQLYCPVPIPSKYHNQSNRESTCHKNESGCHAFNWPPEMCRKMVKNE
jgi:hypothetical protein